MKPSFFRSLSTLQWALGVSIAVHAVVLTVRFVDPERFNRVFEDTPLEVILVNAESNEKPDAAKAIAQSSLAGGGDADQGRATSPLPPSALTEWGDSPDEARQQIEALQQQQMTMLAQVRQQLAALPAVDPRQARSRSPEAKAQEEKRRQLTKLLAEIEQRIKEENARPKKRYISPATRGAVYAMYYDSVRRKTEEKGTSNFPEVAGRKLYGELTMMVTINHDGRVIGVEVVQGSGNLTLDRRAMAIARNAGPFERFNEELRRQADQLVMVSRFRFKRDDTMESRLASQ